MLASCKGQSFWVVYSKESSEKIYSVILLNSLKDCPYYSTNFYLTTKSLLPKICLTAVFFENVIVFQ